MISKIFKAKKIANKISDDLLVKYCCTKDEQKAILKSVIAAICKDENFIVFNRSTFSNFKRSDEGYQKLFEDLAKIFNNSSFVKHTQIIPGKTLVIHI